MLESPGRSPSEEIPSFGEGIKIASKNMIGHAIRLAKLVSPSRASSPTASRNELATLVAAAGAKARALEAPPVLRALRVLPVGDCAAPPFDPHSPLACPCPAE